MLNNFLSHFLYGEENMVMRLKLLRSLRRLHRLMEQNPIEDELRGWSWDKPPLRPRAYLGLGVSEVAYRYCPTRRDVYLKRTGIQGELTSLLQEGIMVHKVFHAAVMDVMRELVLGHKGWEAYEKIASSAEARLSELGIDIAKRPWMLDLYKQLVMAWCSEEWAGLFAEYRVDGSPLGLSRNLRVDGLAEGGVVLEIKYGRPLEFHKVALAGYALALEADLEVPFDYGILVYVKNYNGHASFEWDPIYVSPELRKAFIDARDEVIDMLISGREPPKALNCPSSCPFRGVCT